MGKILVPNQLNFEKKQYTFYPDGRKKAVVVHLLKDGECPCHWEEHSKYFTDGNKVYERL